MTQIQQKDSLEMTASHLVLGTPDRGAGSQHISSARSKTPQLESMPAPCLHAPAQCHSFQISPGCRRQGCQHFTAAEQGRAQSTNNSGKTKQRSKCFWRSEVSYQLDNDCPNTHPAGLHTKTHLFHQKFVI